MTQRSTEGGTERHEVGDPRGDASLEALRQDVLNDPEMRRFLAYLRTRRVALVLSGGGGKGAYQAGVMLALFDCGIRDFCSLAGTSVGGLNAALCHHMCRSDDRGSVLRLWADMAPEKVRRRRPWASLLKVLLYIPLTVDFFFAGDRLGRQQDAYGEYNFEIRHKRYHEGHETRGRHMAGNMRLLLKEIAFRYVMRLIWLVGFAVYGFLVWGAISLSHSLPGYLTLGLGPTPIICAVLLALFILYSVASGYSARLGFHSAAPLRDAIQAVVGPTLPAPPPVVVTLAASPYLSSMSGILSLLRREPVRPIYCALLNLNDLATIAISGHFQTAALVTPGLINDAGDPVDLLMQTAALPEYFQTQPAGQHGLLTDAKSAGFWKLPMKRVGPMFVDGAIADKTPILGVAAFQPDFIITVYLDRKFSAIHDLKEAERRRMRAICTTAGMPVTERTLEKIDEIVDWFAKAEFLPVIPTRDLGGRKGLLDFSAKTARGLIKLGYRDTLNVLRSASVMYAQNRVNLGGSCPFHLVCAVG